MEVVAPSGDMAGKDWKFIMKRAKEKYDQLKGDTHYEWGTPSPAEQQVIALQSKLADVKSENLQISKKLKAKLKDAKKDGRNGGGAGGGQTGGGQTWGGQRQKNKKDISPMRIAIRRTRPGRKWVQKPVRLRPKKRMVRNGTGVSTIRYGAFILPTSVK
jgi:hypothetical protein